MLNINAITNWHTKYALPCMTFEDSVEIYKQFLPEGDHCCGCDGAYDNGCPWCTKERLIEFRKKQILTKFGWNKL